MSLTLLGFLLYVFKFWISYLTQSYSLCLTRSITTKVPRALNVLLSPDFRWILSKFQFFSQKQQQEVIDTLHFGVNRTQKLYEDHFDKPTRIFPSLSLPLILLCPYTVAEPFKGLAPWTWIFVKHKYLHGGTRVGNGKSF